MNRTPAVAGTFYPDNTHELSTMIDQLLQSVKTTGTIPKAIIVPHAGYVYSGPIAASIYAMIRPARNIIKRVVLIGPSHQVPLLGIAATKMQNFSTPFGDIPVDDQAIDKILKFPQVSLMEQAHANEHSLEVQLPFLQKILNEFSIVPLVVGKATSEQVGEILETLWGTKETLIVVSSDLSHYNNYESAQKLDKLTTQAIESLSPEKIEYEQACGRVPINGLLNVAKNKKMQVETIDLRNSGDTAGSKDQVVGYGAYAFR
ncbi:AmmeMemoRadiSam system protein B [Candidatus Halobeggiatoa sp. HSG11]|nr:AmmeMemoRadiSam system protein B [Candidatus Halobeggiatoa sp. HSG11]